MGGQQDARPAVPKPSRRLIEIGLKVKGNDDMTPKAVDPKKGAPRFCPGSARIGFARG
jgi:hypothetical protein